MTFRIALAGAGLIGRRHAQLLAASARARLCAVVDPTEAAAVFAREQGVPHHASLEALFAADERPDGVILATPNHLHVPGALECLRHGVPALIEKPVADTVAEGARLVRAAEAAGVPLLVGHHRRHSDTLLAAREAIASGRIGRVVSVLGSAQFAKPAAYFEAGPWRKTAGGGPILINLIHEMDNLRYLCGEIREVHALASNAVRGFEVEDSAVISLRFASGTLGSFTLSDTGAGPFSWELTSGENPDYPHQDGQDCYIVTGTRGTLAVPTLRTWTYADEASWWQPLVAGQLPPRRNDPLAAQLAHFCDVLAGKVAPRATVADALQSLRVVEAVRLSIHTGAIVAPESIDP